jgi:hypothetical protein
MNTISWNPKVKLVLSDVDETVADLFMPAQPNMIAQLQAILQDDVRLFFITGASLKSVQRRIIDLLPANLHQYILVAHCSGAEVVGYSADGLLLAEPFYSIYDSALTNDQKIKWREVVGQLMSEFKLKTLPTMPVDEFIRQSQGDPLTVMLEDRGPQITLEVVNGYELRPEQERALEFDVPLTHGHLDLRIPLIERAEVLFQEAALPITPKLGGVFAVDLIIKGVSKTTAVHKILQNDQALSSIGLTIDGIQDPSTLEIWGDKFSTLRGGTDRHMSEAVDSHVRSIDFRLEDPAEFLPDYNIQLWNGQQHLHEGLLEYLQSRS